MIGFINLQLTTIITLKGMEINMFTQKIIASRGFHNKLNEQFNLFVEVRENRVILIIDHPEGELEVDVSLDVLKDIQRMCEVALDPNFDHDEVQLPKNVNIGPSTFVPDFLASKNE